MKNQKENPLPISIKDRKALVKVAILIFALFSLLIIQFYNIQIVYAEKWAREAQIQHQFIVKEPFKRGIFYSNTSVKLGHPSTPQPFVIDVTKFHLHIDPKSLPKIKKEEVANKLFVFLKTREKNLPHLLKQFFKKSRDRKIATWLDKDLKDEISKWWYPYARKNRIASNAIFFIKDYQRSYPYGKLLGQVLHTIRATKDRTTKQGIPTGGLELLLNDYLKGKEGKRRLLRSPRHALETGDVIEKPENGADIYLTINHYLQAIAEEELAKGVKRANAKGGIAIMMDPYNGEILAMAHYPFFYPQNYHHYYNDSKRLQYTKAGAISDSFEPGSSMKPITLAICLKANDVLKKRGEPPLFSPNEKISTSDGRFPGRSRPLKDVTRHQFLNMSMALQKSSNIYFGELIHRLIKRLGAEWYRNELIETFGFGTSSTLELPAEHLGKVPRPGALHPNGKLEWSAPTPYSLAMGHNIQVNAIQLIRAAATIANGGILVEPTLIRKIIKTDSNDFKEIILDNTTPERIMKFPRVLDANIAKKVLETMKFVTKWGGTARKADIHGYTEAGKTGTSNKIVGGTYSKKHYFSNFIGFAPAQYPRFVLFIAIDEPEVLFIPGVGQNHYGGQSSAPIFRAIGKRALTYLGITPDDPHGYPRGDPRHNPELADWISETRSLKNKYDEWNPH